MFPSESVLKMNTQKMSLQMLDVHDKGKYSKTCLNGHLNLKETLLSPKLVFLA